MKTIHVSGSRKRAVARATLHEGSGRIRVNKVAVENYRPDMYRLRLREPLMLAGDLAKQVNIDVNVYGGGIMGQTEAARLAIARALVQFSKDGETLKQKYLQYDRNLLIADSRFKETRKPNDSKARAARQKSYR